MQLRSVAVGILLLMLQAQSFSPSLPQQRLPLWRPCTAPPPSIHATSRSKSSSTNCCTNCCSNNRRSSYRTRLQVNPDGLDTLRYCLSVNDDFVFEANLSSTFLALSKHCRKRQDLQKIQQNSANTGYTDENLPSS